MQVTRKTIKQEIDHLDNAQLSQLAEYIAFFKFRSRFQQPTPDLAQFAKLYQEFADEDHQLVEAGLSNYANQLEHENQAWILLPYGIKSECWTEPDSSKS
jgi:hypothetical protein